MHFLAVGHMHGGQIDEWGGVAWGTAVRQRTESCLLVIISG